MPPHRRLRVLVLCLFFRSLLWADAAQDFPTLSRPLTEPSRNRPSVSRAADCQGYVIHISNPKGVYPFEDYTCGSFLQRVTKESDTSVTIRTETPGNLPKPRQAYPVSHVPESISRYLKPTPRIQSNDPAIGKVAQDILASTKPTTEVELVEAVCAWTNGYLTWDLPNEVPDALTCLKRKRGNCIGFSHLAAAVLRNLGVPVRTMRTFVPLNCCAHGHMTRHTLIEVYYPEDDLWVAYDPQGGAVTAMMIYLYTDADWSVEGQRKTRPFSTDPNTRVVVHPR